MLLSGATFKRKKIGGITFVLTVVISTVSPLLLIIDMTFHCHETGANKIT